MKVIDDILESKPLPDTEQEEKKKPSKKMERRELPSIMNEENCVVIDGIKVEIKPTKFKYFRNKTASIYGVLKAMPIQEFFTIPAGKQGFDENRDADKILFDFLVGVFDNANFVAAHYDNMDAEVLDKILEIYGRINGIDKREDQARKNREAQATTR